MIIVPQHHRRTDDLQWHHRATATVNEKIYQKYRYKEKTSKQNNSHCVFAVANCLPSFQSISIQSMLYLFAERIGNNFKVTSTTNDTRESFTMTGPVCIERCCMSDDWRSSTRSDHASVEPATLTRPTSAPARRLQGHAAGLPDFDWQSRCTLPMTASWCQILMIVSCVLLTLQRARCNGCEIVSASDNNNNNNNNQICRAPYAKLQRRRSHSLINALTVAVFDCFKRLLNTHYIQWIFARDGAKKEQE